MWEKEDDETMGLHAQGTLYICMKMTLYNPISGTVNIYHGVAQKGRYLSQAY